MPVILKKVTLVHRCAHTQTHTRVRSFALTPHSHIYTLTVLSVLRLPTLNTFLTPATCFIQSTRPFLLEIM